MRSFTPNPAIANQNDRYLTFAVISRSRRQRKYVGTARTILAVFYRLDVFRVVDRMASSGARYRVR